MNASIGQSYMYNVTEITCTYMYSGKITNFEIDVYKKPGDEILPGVKSLKDKNYFIKSTIC